MSIGLRVVGVYFNEQINIAVVSGTTTIKDVMDEAQKLFAGFSYWPVRSFSGGSGWKLGG